VFKGALDSRDCYNHGQYVEDLIGAQRAATTVGAWTGKLGTCLCNPSFSEDTSCRDCSSGLFGPLCNLKCPHNTNYPFDTATVCNGQGTCNGTLSGDGLCKCTPPYKGLSCTECEPGYRPGPVDNRGTLVC
jgi:hypothetical protein